MNGALAEAGPAYGRRHWLQHHVCNHIFCVVLASKRWKLSSSTSNGAPSELPTQRMSRAPCSIRIRAATCRPPDLRLHQRQQVGHIGGRTCDQLVGQGPVLPLELATVCVVADLQEQPGRHADAQEP